MTMRYSLLGTGSKKLIYTPCHGPDGIGCIHKGSGMLCGPTAWQSWQLLISSMMYLSKSGNQTFSLIRAFVLARP